MKLAAQSDVLFRASGPLDENTHASRASQVAMRLYLGRWGPCQLGVSLLLIGACVGCTSPSAQQVEPWSHLTSLQARVVAVGVANTTALRELAAFFPDDGAAHNDAALTALGAPGGTRAFSRTDVAAALLRRSPGEGAGDMFAVVHADGSVIQLRAGRLDDGLAPAGTVAPLMAPDASNPEAVSARAGVILNWVPDPILYIADPQRNAVVALTLVDDGPVFHLAAIRRLDAPELNLPVDLAPAVLERINPGFSSSTTLAGGADFYVANRGNGTIVRMRQDGTVLAVRSITVSGLGVLGPDRLNAIAVAPDASRIWVSIGGQLPQSGGLEGAILELPAFGIDRTAELSRGMDSLALAPYAAPGADVALQMGLGPAFNGRSCTDCHASPVAGGMGADGLATVLRIGKLDRHGYDPMLGRGGPVAHMHTVAELGIPCALLPGVPPGANLISVRNAPALFGLGLVDEIPDATILAGAVARGKEIHGRANLVAGADGREAVGRFGWKAQVPRLEQFVADALRDEHGITSPLAPRDLTADGVVGTDCGAGRSTPKDDGALVDSLTAFVRSLEALSPGLSEPAGRAIFVATGCAECHTPTLAAGDQALPLYSDLLLHDMGPALDDGVVQGHARGRDWRTTPLWGLSARMRFLHDGRAHTIEAAILAHGGEADATVRAFRTLDHDKRNALLAFLSSL
jgi:mono/diheme cytochrome c family protein